VKKIKGIPENPPFGTLLTILRDSADEPYITSKASSILTHFLGSFQKVEEESIAGSVDFFVEKLKFFQANIKKATSPSDFRIQIKILESLREVLRTDRHKKAFCVHHGLKPLFSLIALDEGQSVKSFQIQSIYSSLYCIWLLSFMREIRREMVDPVFIRNLCFLLKAVTKDKVLRLCLAILKNLLRVAKSEELMISFGLPKSIEIIKSKPALVSDKDILEDATTIEESLDKIVDELTTFDVYRNEVLSTKLEWSPPHKSQKFLD